MNRAADTGPGRPPHEPSPPGPEDTLLDALRGPALPSHLYIHVPFCRTKCSYCDFVSITDLSDLRVEPVCRGLEGEVARWAAASLPGVLETVYIGGGTPTILAARLIGLVRSVFDSLPHTPSCEVTVEANPDSWTPLLAEGLAATGVTRISLGVQSFDERTLALLGRVHTVAEAVDAARSIRLSGLDLSVDLMCGIPGLRDEVWVDTLQQAVATGAGHISVYPLTLEENTPLAVACGSGLVVAPDSDQAADQMLLAEEVLSSAGLNRY
ncbi:MAG: coproporphyrinogen-III oxidase family protein, partial [Actinomycetota bacterium]|nr:coproporphyrinogen-III oxidase family protein [Actinomycetota bacterium]